MSDRPKDHSKRAPGGTGEPSTALFISYARGDKDVAQKLAKRLQDRGFATWLDIENIQPGEDWSKKLRDAIENSRICLVLISDKTNPPTPWVSKEWATIQDTSWRQPNLSICPVLLDDVVPPAFLRKWQGVRMSRESENIQEAVDNIVKLLRQHSPGRAKGISDADLSETAARFSEMTNTLTEGQKAASNE